LWAQEDHRRAQQRRAQQFHREEQIECVAPGNGGDEPVNHRLPEPVGFECVSLKDPRARADVLHFGPERLIN